MRVRPSRQLRGRTAVRVSHLTPGVLVAVARRASQRGGSLHAVCSRPPTRKLLWMTGVDRRIPLTATVDGALKLLTPSGDAPGS